MVLRAPSPKGTDAYRSVMKKEENVIMFLSWFFEVHNESVLSN